jgi:acetolactate synthase-1/2/3 large subunit
VPDKPGIHIHVPVRRNDEDREDKMKMTGAEVLTRIMEVNGIKYLFGVPGGHLLKFYDAVSSSSLSPVLTKHESGASFMATGYAQVSGHIGACTGTVGPGATNLVTGIASAYMDSVPVLAVTAQVGGGAVGKGGLQEATGEGRTIDHVELFDGLTKYSSRVFSANKIMEASLSALRLAVNGRPGPVHLDVMADAFAAETDKAGSGPESRVRRYTAAAPVEIVREIFDLLQSAANPAILAGAGALNASDEVARLAEYFRIPVATTVRAKGLIPENHDLSLGCVGLYGTNAANKYLKSGIDVLLVAGASMSEFTTHAWDPGFQPSAALIQIDVDPWEVGKNYPVSIGVTADIKNVLVRLLEEMDGGKSQVRDGIRNRVLKLKQERRFFKDPKMERDDVPLKPQRLMKLLRSAFPAETIVFADIGNTLPWAEAYYQSILPGTFHTCSSMASMGYAVSASIGGQLAAPDRQVVCFCGDGDFQMQAMEVVTAVNYNIPVKWVIMNNSKLAMIGDLQDILLKGRRTASEFVNPDFVKLAESMGAAGLRISTPAEAAAVLRQALENGRPTVIDVPIDPREFPPFDARAEAITRAWGASAPLLEKIKLVPQMLKRR